jgi:segregation and condensation protein B
VTRSNESASALLDPGILEAAVEAVLFAAGEAVAPKEIAAAFESVGEEEVVRTLETLRSRFERTGSGIALERVAGAYRLVTRADVGPWIRKFFRQRNRARLSPAALETLAIVAYRQPVTAPEVQAIRGVDPGGALKSLLDKKLVRILGRKKVVGNPLLYGTSKQFLLHFGLDRLEDLPSIDEFEEFLGGIDGAPHPLFERTDGVAVPAEDAADTSEPVPFEPEGPEEAP